MDTSYKGMLVALLVIGGMAGNAIAQTAPAPSTGVPGASAATNPKISAAWTDKNGDGLIQKDELAPNSQLYKRFDTRDTNHDGTLTRDEYYY